MRALPVILLAAAGTGVAVVLSALPASGVVFPPPVPRYVFGSVGLTSGQTLRVTAASTSLIRGVESPLPFQAIRFTVLDAGGSVLVTADKQLGPGHTVWLDVPGATAAAAGRTQVRAEVQVRPSPVATPVVAASQVVTSVEVFDSTTGATAVLNATPLATIAPAGP